MDLQYLSVMIRSRFHRYYFIRDQSYLRAVFFLCLIDFISHIEHMLYFWD